MASQSESNRTYHVFLSFRGADVRNNIVSHLYKALDQRGISTFMDSEELRKGEQISPVFVKAIEESRIAIIVFSENFASSTLCLDEVAKIMDCKETNGLSVLPVFYKVDPREVRQGRNTYKEAFDKHENKYGNDSEDVKKWKKALMDAASLSAFEFNDGNEAELVESIVRKITTTTEA